MGFNKFEKYFVLFLFVACIYFFMGIFIPSVLMGIIVAVTLTPLYKRNFFNLHSTYKAALITSIFAFLLILPIALVITFGAIQGRDVLFKINLDQATLISNQFYDFLSHQKISSLFLDSEKFTLIRYNQFLMESGLSLKEKSLDILQNIVTTIPWILFSFVIVAATVFFTLVDGFKFKNILVKNTFYPESFGNMLADEFTNVSKAVIFATLGSAVAQASIILIPSLIFNTSSFAFIVFATFFMSMVPVVGTAPVIIALIISHYLDHNITAVTSYIVFGLLIGAVDNIIRAKIIERTSKVHPFVAFLSAIGGVKAMGFFGLFLGPVITIVLIKAFRTMLIRRNRDDR